jgi:type IV secretion system protein VirB9
MIRSLFAVTTALALASPALAEDARLVSRLYNPNEVVRINGQTGVQASIAFAEDEHIENVAIGDSASWQVTPNRRTNILFVKPLNARAHTNMTVVTDRHTYYFDLVAGAGAHPLYVLRFTYPEPSATTPGSSAASAQLTATESQVIADPAASAPVDPASLNFAWQTRGKARLFPARIYDDGSSTYVSWPVGSPIPAILIDDGRGNEGPVNFAVRGDVIIVDGVPSIIKLRSGKDLATLENRGPQRPTGPAPALAQASTTPAPALEQ